MSTDSLHQDLMIVKGILGEIRCRQKLLKNKLRCNPSKADEIHHERRALENETEIVSISLKIIEHCLSN